MFRTRGVRMRRDVFEAECSRVDDVVRSGMNLDNKLWELLEEKFMEALLREPKLMYMFGWKRLNMKKRKYWMIIPEDSERVRIKLFSRRENVAIVE
ncbi:hypothetical protein A2U01_0050910, partial [Trifolium medium]|nr:hypothetical protein [Trifolium medium]